MRIILILVSLAVYETSAQLDYDSTSQKKNLASPFRENVERISTGVGLRNNPQARTPGSRFGGNAINPSRKIPSSNSRGPSGSSVVTLIDQRDGPHADGSYNFAFQTSDGVQRQERGRPTSSGAVAQEGGYSITYPDGTVGEFKFIADENGFRVESPLLPTPPPLPAHAVQQIENAQREDAHNNNNNQRGFASHNSGRQGSFETQQGIAQGGYRFNALGGRNEFGSPSSNRQDPSVSQFGNNQGSLRNQIGNNQGNVRSNDQGRLTGFGSQLGSSHRGVGSQRNGNQGAHSSQSRGNRNSFRNQGGNRQSGNVLSSSTSKHNNILTGFRSQPTSTGNNLISHLRSSSASFKPSINGQQVFFGSQISTSPNRIQAQSAQVQGALRSNKGRNQPSGILQAGNNHGGFQSQQGSQSDIRQFLKGRNPVVLGSQQRSNTNQGSRAQIGHDQGRIGSQKGGIGTQPGSPLHTDGFRSNIGQSQGHNIQGKFGSQQRSNPNQRLEIQAGIRQDIFGSQQTGFIPQTLTGNSRGGIVSQIGINTNPGFVSQIGNIQDNSRTHQGIGNKRFDSKNIIIRGDNQPQLSQPQIPGASYAKI